MGPGTSPPYKEGRNGFGGIHTQKRRTSRWGWAALTKVLQGEGMSVIEVNRPDGQHRRLKGKIDSLDAYRAAHSVVSGRSTAVPEAKDGLPSASRSCAQYEYAPKSVPRFPRRPYRTPGTRPAIQTLDLGPAAT